MVRRAGAGLTANDRRLVPVMDFNLCRVYDDLAGRTDLNHHGEAGAASIARASQTLNEFHCRFWGGWARLVPGHAQSKGRERGIAKHPQLPITLPFKSR